MGSERSLLLVFSSLVLLTLCKSEFVPVYMWGTHGTSDPVPALHKTSQSSFKDEITNKLQNTPTIIVFAEQSLSPEDFGQRDRSGNVAFPNLSKARKTSKVTYLSYVQNAIKATKHASDDVAEISIERLKENFEIPESRIVIIDLNDASEDEQRFDMLKRHDEFIASVYDHLLKKNDNVLALYTAHHASWIGSGEGKIHSRKTRALLPDESNVNQYMDNTTVMFYTSGPPTVTVGGSSRLISLNYSVSNESGILILTGNGAGENGSLVVSFQFLKTISGYWYLQEATFNLTSSELSFSQITNATIYAPVGFSFACGNQVFNDTAFSVIFPHFQVQPAVYKSSYWTRNIMFDDPYNCVGFTTIPIWSGLFVTFILLLIMTFGLTMMMDIKTMDRFDDPKGKTITINTSE